MIVDGKAIAESIKADIKSQIEKLEKKPTLFVLVQTDDAVIQKFVGVKEKMAKDLGVTVSVQKAEEKASAEKLIAHIKRAVQKYDGIIVQLPLSPHVDVEAVLNAVPMSHDVDVLAHESVEKFEKGELSIMPPVIGAMEEILVRNNISVAGKKAVVVGRGRLVGKPVASWLNQKAADVSVISRGTASIEDETKEADVLVLGSGVPRLITPNMIKEGVVILDAGTSEEGGKLAGDADPACAEKAALFTPVPGGIGPITVALIFKNLSLLMRGKA